jgi:transcriptional regulator with XRE-family HTH domain
VLHYTFFYVILLHEVISVYDRIKQLRKYLGKTQSDFGSSLGVTRDVVANWENGRVSVPDSVIILICREFGVNESWLRTGEGEMATVSTRDEELAAFMGRVLADRPDSIRRRLIYALSRLDESGWEVVDQMAELIVAEKKEKPEE